MTIEISRRFAESWPPRAWQDLTVMLAVSGGPDSVALARLVSQHRSAGRGRCVVAHFNHGWRSKAADRDEAFVRDLAGRLGWEIVVQRSPTAKSSRKPVEPKGVASKPAAAETAAESEKTARDARYAFFRRAAEHCGARYVATAHTANDQAETILHRILRGTSVAGLAGIPRARQLSQAVTVIRPLLTFRRDQLLDYLQSCGQPYCSDLTNCDPAYTRNRIRHALLPQLAREYNQEIVASLLRLGRTAAEMQEVVDRQVDHWSDRCLVKADPLGVELDTTAIADLPRHLVRQLFVDIWRRQGWPLRDMGYDQWEALASILLAEEPTVRIFPGNVRASRRGSRMCLLRR